MTAPSPKPQRQALEENLLQRAALLWGQEQAEALRPNITQLAENVERLDQNPPGREIEPGFFMV